MDIFVLIGLIAIIFALAGPVAFFLTLGARERLRAAERRLEQAETRLWRLEHAPPPTPVIVAAPEPAPEPPREALVETPPEFEIADARVEEPALESAIEPPPPPPLPPPPPPRVEAPPAPPRRTLEETLGTRWTVWVGGLALGLGALLLVRYSIEQGYFGPAARIMMALALAVALIAAGEWLRRRERGAVPAAAYIPGVLTAVGAVAGFGAIYGAYALYGFIGPAAAFIALGVVGVACMFAAALHGPALAGLGLVGSLTTPMLVSTDDPNPWALVLYLAVVAPSAYGLARLRHWLWLAIATAVGCGLWAAPLLDGGASFTQADMAHVVIQTALACIFLGIAPWLGTQTEEPDAVASIAPAAFGLLGLIVLANLREPGAAMLLMLAAMIALLAITGLFSAPATLGVVSAGVFTLGALTLWPKAPYKDAPALDPEAVVFHWPPPAEPGLFGWFALLASLALGAVCVRALLGVWRTRPVNVVALAGAGALTPLGALVIAWLRVGRPETDFVFPSLAAGLAAAFLLAATLFQRRRDTADLGLGAAASGALAALALAFVFALSGGTLTMALALAALGAAFVSVRLDIPALRWCVAGLGVAVAARLAWEPRIVGAALSPTPVFNWLLAGYGVPAVAFAAAARVLRRHGGEDTPARIARALGILLAFFLVVFELRHWLYGGDLYATRCDFVETGLYVASAFGFSAVLTQLDRAERSVILEFGSIGFGLLAMATAIGGLLVVVNPYFNSVEVAGGPLINTLLVGYVAPALVGFVLSLAARGVRPAWYVTAIRVTTMALAFAYITLETRRAFHDASSIDFWRSTSDAELYAYSAVWLAFGLILLGWGLWRGSREARIASAGLITLTVLKAFLFDMAGLEGLWRALSFLGLGLVLIGIGLVYQKLVFARPAPPVSPPVDPPVL